MLASHLPISPGERTRIGAWMSAARLTPIGDSKDGLYVAETLRRLAAEWEERLSCRTGLLDGYLTTALVLTARLAEPAAGEEVAAASENERRMERFDALLRQHYLTHKPAAFYARQLGFSRTHLNRVVRAVIGRSIHEVIAGRLVDEAKRQLVFTRGSVQEIGSAWAFPIQPISHASS
ncbi:helix-turn-helix domain-containing protein [Sinorhizobium meliloti]|uniref:helix-turn-helix domain-containing protein n=1 Tax=Rhizobium meliloti TaxID=382 RepID=UPI003F5CCB2D